MLPLKPYQQDALDTLARYLVLAGKTGAKRAFIEVTERPYHSVEGLPELPYVCIRIPTGGGKTLVACHSIAVTAQEFLRQDRALVLWLVPTNTIKEQTLRALRDRKHPYRAALDATLEGRVSVLDLQEALYLQRSTLDGDTTIVVFTLAALRVENTDGRKIYDQNGSLMSHFSGLPDGLTEGLDPHEDGRPVYSLANVLRMRRPVVIVDEAHNARTDLSFDTLARFNPSCILEFTATPAQPPRTNPSNVVYSCSADELRSDGMIKLPIHLQTHVDWRAAVGSAVKRREELERLARAEEDATGEYFRPIALMQAQPRRQNQETLGVDVVSAALVEWGFPPRANRCRNRGDRRDRSLGEGARQDAPGP